MIARKTVKRLAPGGARTATLVAAVVAATVAAALCLLSGGPALGATGGPWLKAAVRSPLFLFCGVVILGCVGVLAVLCGALWAAGSARRGQRQRNPGSMPFQLSGQGHCRTGEAEEEAGEARRGQDALGTQGRDPCGQAALATEGAATLEFALVLPIALMVVLIMMQASLLLGGNLCVQYSAFCAARTAIVTVPRALGDEAPNMVGDPGSSSKMRRIQMAAVWALLPVSSTHPQAPTVSAGAIQSGLGTIFSSAGLQTPPWTGAEMDRRLGYAQEHTTVEMDPPTGRIPPGGGAIPPLAPKPGGYAAGEDLHVRVQHDFYMVVPYAARIFSKLTGDSKPLEFGSGQYAIVMKADCTLTNEGEQDFVDVERFPKSK